jgi:hypothetical protein
MTIVSHNFVKELDDDKSKTQKKIKLSWWSSIIVVYPSQRLYKLLRPSIDWSNKIGDVQLAGLSLKMRPNQRTTFHYHTKLLSINLTVISQKVGFSLRKMPKIV